MNIYITDKGETRRIRLRHWEDGNWSPDMFDDVADALPIEYPISYADSIEHDARAAMTDSEYRETVAFWESEVSNWEDGENYGLEAD